MDRYYFTVKGHLADYWSYSFEDSVLTRLPDGTTRISCDVIDQSHLHSILSKIRDLGLILLSVSQNP